MLRRHAEEWGELKLFSVQVPVNPGDITWLDKEAPIFHKLAKVVTAVTKTPDFTQKAELRLYDKNHRCWAPGPDHAALSIMSPREELLLDVPALFKRGAHVLRQAVLLRGRALVAADVVMDLMPNESLYPALTDRIQAGALDQKLRTLAEMHLQFFYLGPPPYPPGKLHTFDYATETWKPLRS